MNTINRIDIVRNVAEKADIKHDVAVKAVDAILDQIQATLGEGGRVELRGFGIWETKMSKPRMGRNPAVAGSKSFVIPPRRILRFKMGTQLKAAVRLNQQV